MANVLDIASSRDSVSHKDFMMESYIVVEVAAIANKKRNIDLEGADSQSISLRISLLYGHLSQTVFRAIDFRVRWYPVVRDETLFAGVAIAWRQYL